MFHSMATLNLDDGLTILSAGCTRACAGRHRGSDATGEGGGGGDDDGDGDDAYE